MADSPTALKGSVTVGRYRRVTRKVQKGIAKQIMAAYQAKGRDVRLKGMRFIPSTVIELGGGKFEVIANSVIEVQQPGGLPRRSESIDSVVTIDRLKSGQELRGVKIPSLEIAAT